MRTDNIEKIVSVLGGKDKYPPSGWHDIHGNTGKSALIWSLCSWRTQVNNRDTLVVQLTEPYEYIEAAQWAGVPVSKLHVLHTYNKTLDCLLEILEESDEIGQVILEGLGFILGSGKVSPRTESFLGNQSNLFKLSQIAKEKDIALYSTSYNVYRPTGIIKTASLGGSIMLHLCTERRIILNRLKFYHPRGFHEAEKLSMRNALDPNRYCEGIIKYKKGPIKIL